MLDAHIHLQDIPTEKREELIAYLCDQKFSTLFCNGTSPRDWEQVLSIAERVEMITPFIGVHPWYIDSLSSDWENDFVHLMRHHKCGVGEIGLDKTPKSGDFERQKFFLVRQLDVSLMLRRPFVLHCVKAWGPMMAILRSYDFLGIPFVVHSFIGSMDLLKELLDMGAMISISQRSLGHKDATDLISAISHDRLLLETDFPYLPGKDKDAVGVEDYWGAITQVYDRAAEIQGVSTEVLTQQILENSRKVLQYI